MELQVAPGYRPAAGVMPQVVQRGDQLHGRGGTREQLEGFLDRLDAMLGDSIVLIRKAASGSQFVRFEASLGRGGYMPGQPQLVATPDTQAFWIETRDEGADGAATRCVLQRAASIAVQVAGADAADAAEFLSALKANLTRLRDVSAPSS